MDIIIVNSAAVLLIIFVIVWFFGSKPKAKRGEADKPIPVLVKDGIYEPSHIQIPAGKAVKLHFIRKDATPCAETVSFLQLNISYSLPVNEKVEIVIPPQQPGQIDFTCQMGMYRGKLIVI
ncbi:cupredoxin domain-containing protein [Aquicella lusitana]|mgnify:CR=1 FL=1|uniref:Cupredoxin-like protein n=1 Tax=Aquicella lusitana TaxID=254246 RepID=A0A370GXE0_9COXI|nr:cupredoxin domain-containing protein [Aquicella lusitana]RDI46553.1 cupredoxin-like protein [Aquicella lusitana]VVC74217.1 hypothetical protein AQULUS_19820 [Aquicella lusitana]